MTINISDVPLEQWSVEDISEYPFNHKKHPEKQIDLLMRSIKAQGLLDPIAIDEKGVIISGHGRFEAIKRLGWLKVTVRCLRGISDAEASALRIAANRTVSNEYDTDMLQRELETLQSVDFDMGSLGMEQRELDMLLLDVGELDDAAITLDIDQAVEDHEQEIADHSVATDEVEVRLDKAFGFKTIPLRAQKTITRFLAVAEAQTGKVGVEALLAHMTRIVETA